MPKPVALWSTPRSVSTAFDKMMRGRGDHRVFTEPFSVPYYFGPDRGSDRFAGDDTVEPATYEQVCQELDEAAAIGPVFVKAMPHHLGAELGAAVLNRFTSSFLIRDPAWSVPSMLAKWPDATDAELGYEAQRRAFDLVSAVAGLPPVIDATNLRSDPEAVVEAWCRAVDVEHQPESLTWDPGMPDDWQLWSDWFQRAGASTCFAPPDGRPAPEVTPEVARRIDRCRPHYEALAAHQLC